jgi:hypothetical protein
MRSVDRSAQCGSSALPHRTRPLMLLALRKELRRRFVRLCHWFYLVSRRIEQLKEDALEHSRLLEVHRSRRAV